ncbi:MAG TPA: ribosomal L7Ae/L30e/S12e/Gadd45 family protein [Bacillota bacterium]|nr:ribosomal L7Ae/L30e/S12e/Gadd45 family protein [Bacillota bacterium]
MKNRYLNMIGLAYRAGQCSIGEENIIKDIQKRRAHLILLANDIGMQTKKKLIDKCETYKVPYMIVDDRETLSQSIGKTNRVALAILEKGFATKIQSLLR